MSLQGVERLDSRALSYGLRLEGARDAIRDQAQETVTVHADAAAAAPGGGATDAVVWDQNYRLDNSFHITGNQVANDFVLGAAEDLVRFTVVLSDDAINNNGVLDSFSGTLGWGIYANAGGLPGALITSGVGTPVLTDTGVNDNFAADLVLAQMTLAAPVSLAAGAYWLGIEEGGLDAASDGSRVWWQAADTVGTRAVIKANGPGPFITDIDLDCAFTLEGAAAPSEIENAGLTLDEGATAGIGAALLEFEDNLNPSAGVTYAISTAAQHGTVTKDGTGLDVGGTFTQADVDAGKIAYVHDGSEATTDSFGFSVADSDVTLLSQTFAITVNAVNDAPQVSVPVSISGQVDAPLIVSGISFSDADAGVSSVTVALAASRGTLAAADAGGVTVSGTGTNELVLTGEIAAINAFIAGFAVTFQTGLHDTADAEIEATIDDGGASGSGGPKQGSASFDILVLDARDGTAADDRVVGSAKDSTLSGLSGDDKLHGGAGDDVLNGGDDDDLLKGSSGDDTLKGDAGDDRLVGRGGDNLIDGGDGVDTVDYRRCTVGVTLDLVLETASCDGEDTVENVERAIGTGHGDGLYGDGLANGLFGAAGDDSMFGRAGNDYLDGGDGDDGLFGGDDQDRLRGSAGDDGLSGDLGDDILIGGDGADSLMGGRGADSLIGGAGADVFLYGHIEESTYPSPFDPSTPLADVIYGFKPGDRIDLSAIDANASTVGDDAFHLGFDDGVAGAIGVRYDAGADQTLVELYVHDDPDLVIDGLIILDGKHANLTAADFVL